MGTRTERQRLGDLGEIFVAQELQKAGFEVKLIGGNFPGYDILASPIELGSEIRVQVKTWSECTNDRPLAKIHRLHMSDVFVLVRADNESILLPYVYTVDEIAIAKPIGETKQGFPFTRDPGIKNLDKAGFWTRRNWLFCDKERLNAWHLVRPCPIEPIRQLASKPNNLNYSIVEPKIVEVKQSAKLDREVRNGVRSPKPGGLCAKAWDACDHLAKELGRTPSRREAMDYGNSFGLNTGNVSTEYSYWKRFNAL
jgi:hypothetical protein